MTLSHEQVVQAVDESDWTLLIDCLHIIAVEDWWGRFLATGEVQFLANDTGVIFWRDLTVPNAEQVRDFYSQVVGWRAEPLEIGDYADFIMTAPGADQPTAGLCHARGVNADLPATSKLPILTKPSLSVRRWVTHCCWPQTDGGDPTLRRHPRSSRRGGWVDGLRQET